MNQQKLDFFASIKGSSEGHFISVVYEVLKEIKALNASKRLNKAELEIISRIALSMHKEYWDRLTKEHGKI
jgi:hypothetical protein